MSEDYHLACYQCKDHIWIGQSQNSGHPFCFYFGEPEIMEELRDFLWKHSGHPLIMEDFQELELRGVIKNEEGKSNEHTSKRNSDVHPDAK